MSDKINHNIMNENVIDREELIEYLTLILENDGELERFYDREVLRNDEDDPVPDVRGFRDWLEEQTFDTIIRDIYFEEYVKELFISMDEYDPNSFLHRHINWNRVYQELLDNDYDNLFEGYDDPFNIFKRDFYYHN